MKKLLILLIIVFLAGCNQGKINHLRNQISELENEIEQKETRISTLRTELDMLYTRYNNLSLKNEKLNNELKNYKKPTRSNSDIIRAFREHASFYCDNHEFANYNVRKSAENTYDISFEYGSEATINWHSNTMEFRKAVATLTFQIQDQFMISTISGPSCLLGI